MASTLGKGNTSYHSALVPDPGLLSIPIRSYSVLPTPTWGRTSSFTIQISEGFSTETSLINPPIYTISIQREALGFGDSQINIYNPADKTILAACRLKGWANQKYIHLGNPDCTALADWTRVRPSAKFDPSKFTFVAGGEEYCWTRTHRTEYGASKWTGKSFKLIRVRDGMVTAVFVHAGKWKRRDEARVDWFEKVTWEVEVLGLAAVLGIQEEIRRSE